MIGIPKKNIAIFISRRRRYLRPKKIKLWSQLMCYLFVIGLPINASAQQHSYSPNTDNDGGAEFRDCAVDIRRYCNAWGPLLYELENCLLAHESALSNSCLSHLKNTDFRKYHENMGDDF